MPGASISTYGYSPFIYIYDCDGNIVSRIIIYTGAFLCINDMEVTSNNYLNFPPNSSGQKIFGIHLVGLTDLYQIPGMPTFGPTFPKTLQNFDAFYERIRVNFGSINSPYSPPIATADKGFRFGSDFIGASNTPADDIAYSIKKINDQDFIIAGASNGLFFNGAPSSPNPAPLQATRSTPSVIQSDGFILKVDVSQNAASAYPRPPLTAFTYYGGSGDDLIYSVDLDANNKISFCGTTSSTDLFASRKTMNYTTGGLSTYFNTSPHLSFYTYRNDAFVGQLKTDFSNTIWENTFGGNRCTSGNQITSGFESAFRLNLDKINNTLYVCGGTSSNNFPCTNDAIYNTNASPCNFDGFIMKINNTTGATNYSSYHGGSDFDELRSIQTQNSSYIICGTTKSNDAPGITTNNGKSDMYLAKLTSNNSLKFALNIGDVENDYGFDCSYEENGYSEFSGTYAQVFSTPDYYHKSIAIRIADLDFDLINQNSTFNGLNLNITGTGNSGINWEYSQPNIPPGLPNIVSSTTLFLSNNPASLPSGTEPIYYRVNAVFNNSFNCSFKTEDHDFYFPRVNFHGSSNSLITSCTPSSSIAIDLSCYIPNSYNVKWYADGIEIPNTYNQTSIFPTSFKKGIVNYQASFVSLSGKVYYSKSIQIEYLIDAEITILGSASKCKGSPVTLSASIPANTAPLYQTYQWYFLDLDGNLHTLGTAQTETVTNPGTYYFITSNTVCSLAVKSNEIIIRDIDPFMDATYNLVNSIHVSTELTIIQPTAGFYSAIEFYWNGILIQGPSSNATVTVDKPGRYYAKVQCACGYLVSNEFYYNSNCDNPHYYSAFQSGWTFSTNTTLNNSYLVNGVPATGFTFGGDIIIQAGVTLIIDNTNVEFINCGQIIVEPGGTLVVSYSKIFGCGKWKGIKVTSNNTLKGKVEILGSANIKSSIMNAVNGIYSFSGGQFDVSDCIFANNFVHIAGLLSPSSLSKVQNCDFYDVWNEAPSTCESQGTFTAKANTLFYCKSLNNTYIKNCTFTGNTKKYDHNKTGIYIEELDNTMGTIFLSGNILKGAMQYGMQIINSNNLTFGNNAGIVSTDYCRFEGNVLTGIYINGSHDLNINNNKFDGSMYKVYQLPPLASSLNFNDGIVLKNSNSCNLNWNKFYYMVNGMQIYNNSLTQGVTSVTKNIFESCLQGLVISPVQHPFIYKGATHSQSFTGTQQVNFYCNQFIKNDYAVLGSGKNITQGNANAYNNNNDFNIGTLLGNTKWDIAWENYNPFQISYIFKVTPQPNSSTPNSNIQINKTTSSGFSNGCNFASWFNDYCQNSAYWKTKQVGINAINKNKTSVYPNPLIESTFNIVSTTSLNSIKIFDISGRIIEFTQSNLGDNKYSINLGNVAAGVYTIIIRDEFNTQTVYKICKLNK